MPPLDSTGLEGLQSPLKTGATLPLSQVGCSRRLFNDSIARFYNRTMGLKLSATLKLHSVARLLLAIVTSHTS
jgi:hypothetical protein